MAKRIVIIQGHPDPRRERFGRALAAAYADGAAAAGHEVRAVDVAAIDFPILRTREEWESGPLPGTLRGAQDAIRWADHLVLLFPLWAGTMPALLKAFLEQVFRPGFAMAASKRDLLWEKRLAGKSARVVVTMGMPAFVFRWWFRAHALKGLERNILAFCGIGPIRESLVGSVDSPDDAARQEWLARMRALGRKGE
ncbi:MAG TPA: NAD(P)H-dependent oxidoreductase [Burkholderiales bacterium]